MYIVYKDDQKLGYLLDTDTDTIARFVAGIEENHCHVMITDMFDLPVLTTMGNFLDYVPNQEWLRNELLPILIPYQNGSKSFDKVKVMSSEEYQQYVFEEEFKDELERM